MNIREIVKLFHKLRAVLLEIEARLDLIDFGTLSPQDRQALNSLRRGVIRALYKLRLPR